ncbi:MAG: trimeric intracellular cation channel family protein [Candidatus Woykebacteria bacterium]
MSSEIYILDLLGTFTFAIYGVHVAIKKGFDIFGIFVCAFLTALGGGTLRELILNHTPFYFYDMNYIYAVLLGIITSIVIYQVFSKINKYMLVVDAVGLSTFALIGSVKADEAELGFFAIVFFAPLTAAGGGIVRDIAIREIPKLFYSDFYASPAIFLGVVYALWGKEYPNSAFIYILLLTTFALRVMAMNRNVNLWGPWIKDHKSKKPIINFPFKFKTKSPAASKFLFALKKALLG